MEPNNKILILDFGGQYSQLIARRIREKKVYCEIKPYKISLAEIQEINPKGIIFSGGPASVYEEKSPKCDEKIFYSNIPVLGICYGMQLMALELGGEVERFEKREYGIFPFEIMKNKKIFANLKGSIKALMSHGDSIKKSPEGFEILGKTENTPIGAFSNEKKNLYGVQFHPEVSNTENGDIILDNFLFNICNCEQDWTMESFVETSIKEIKGKAKDTKVLCALSGGIDSAVAALLVHKAIGDNLTCIFVDHGLLRKNEEVDVVKVFRDTFDMNLIKIDARKRFLDKLKGVIDPEKKRKIIGEEFIRVFEEEAKKIGKVDYLVQGTLYPDIIESGTDTAEVIKSHHNVGGLPEDMDFDLIEPLRDLFKDEVRKAAQELGLPEKIVWRQPFPGPGLAVRVLGEITEEKLEALREADAIVTEEIKKAGLYKDIWQSFAVLPDMKSVGVMGDTRTYARAIILRAVNSTDGMTAEWVKLPYEVLERISSRIVNEVEGVNRVAYDITSKPPGTIEWE